MRTETSEVLVIGSGGAGLRAAIELYDNNIDVRIVGKCKKREAHTWMAQGGINAALGNMDPEDTWQIHAADTIRDGGEINDSVAVSLLCHHAPQAIKELKQWGCPFNTDDDGNVLQRFFGAASYRRACFSGSSTGLAILNTLVDQVEKREIPFHSEVYIFSLLETGGKVNGALGLDINTGETICFHAKAVILATGGHSRMYRRSSSHFSENNGDGIGLAFALGASCIDMEMFQFHPTGMVFPEAAEGLLITEATRGEGGILTNSEGERFMEQYAPERLELSARDVVARANHLEIEAGRGTEHGGVYLDISHKPKEYIMERLPSIYEQYMEHTGKDISEEKMEVAPTAHYSMGGLYIDHATGRLLQAGTDDVAIKNLYAIGEVGGGVHGGNRLGGNSLAEILVFGRLVGEYLFHEMASAELLPLDEQQIQEKAKTLEAVTQTGDGKDPIQLKKEIQKIMSEHVGVVRDEVGLTKALEKILALKSTTLSAGKELKQNEKLIAALDVAHMFPICEMIIRSALMRTESRAAHYRRDYLETDPEWKRNILCSTEDGEIKLRTKPVPKVPEEIEKEMEVKRKVSKELVE